MKARASVPALYVKKDSVNSKTTVFDSLRILVEPAQTVDFDFLSPTLYFTMVYVLSP